MFPCSHMGLDYLLDVNIFQYIVSGDYVLALFFCKKKKHNKFLLVFLCLFIPSLIFKEGGGKKARRF